MGPAVEPSTNTKQSTLQKALTSALNELGLDAALIAIHIGDNGPLVAQVSRGLFPFRRSHQNLWSKVAEPRAAIRKSSDYA
jgi:hypothetical protein